ncbi:MAG: helix-turn-helix transcriptional regulator [Dehalococcoidia bacterium]
MKDDGHANTRESNPPKDVISVDDVAAACGLSRSTLYRLMERHGIRKYRRAGDRKTYVSLSAVQAVTGFREVE